MLALNNRSMFIQHQNNSVCWDGKRFVMAVDLLGGPCNFTVLCLPSGPLYCIAQAVLCRWMVLPDSRPEHR